MGRGAIVLAAGHGTRMKSKRHKVLHPVCGKPMIVHILDELQKLELDQIVVVVGQQREKVATVVGSRADIAVQEPQLGTGHAVQCAMPVLRPGIDDVVVLYGDAPLIRAETIGQLFAERAKQQAAAVCLTARVQNPFGLGRIILDEGGMVGRIVEEKDANAEEKNIHLINTGIYAFSTESLVSALGQLNNDNAQREYYLTDTLGILRRENRAVYPLEIADADEIASVNDRVQLAQVERLLRTRICEKWMREGVTIIHPDSTYIGPDVAIGPDTVLYPGTILEGKTAIGEDCVIGPNTRLLDARIQNGASLEYAVVLQSEVGEEAHVGPFAYVRPGSTIGPRVKIGDFVEVKNSKIDADTKVSHLTYIGDADVGQRVNVGCGVITVNYDGKHKHRTVIGDGSFVGSNVNLIAPVNVGEGAYLVAGSTITDDVPDDAFAIARERQVTKENYVSRWKNDRFSKEE